MDNRPIGVFDSGVGGLTAVRELHRILPGEDIVYFGDTARVPYGTRSSGTIRLFARQIVRFLGTRDVKAMVVACGTISTNLSDRDEAVSSLGVPYLTVVDPTVKNAAAKTKTGRIGVIATPATIRTGAFDRALRGLLPGAEVFPQACPLLVPLVENGLTGFNNQITRLTLEMYLRPVLEQSIDTLILGCTHYPLLYDIIGDIAGPDIALVDAGASVAGEMKRLLDETGMHSGSAQGHTAYYVTDTVGNFVSVAKNFLFESIEKDSRHVDLEMIERE
jgi:glutamate racemase